MAPSQEYDAEEEAILNRPIRFSLDLEPTEYAALCRIICSHRERGRKVSMRSLIRGAIHHSYPQTVASAS